MKFAIWTAVSSEAQAAADKVSLSEQENKCRAAGTAKAWSESAGPFVVPGESRTRWVNLRDAENAIPALRNMLDAAQRREFDVLVLYAYDRLRELLDPVSRTLAAYGVQLYSVSQPVEPMPAEQYDLYATDTSNAVQFVSSLTSRAEINAMRRRYRMGIPRRVTDKGLHTVGLLPFGYRKPPGRELDASVTPIIDAGRAAALIRAKELFLAGQSVPQVAEWLNTTEVRPPRVERWSASSLRKMLRNPYYAGLVQHGAIRRSRDPRTGTYKDRIITDKSKIIEANGRHEPLWSIADYRAILAEMRRRARYFKGRHTQRLSRLLYCGICGAPLHMTYYGNSFDDKHRAWYCRSVSKTWHMKIRDSEALDALAAALSRDLANPERLADEPEPKDHRELLLAAVEDLKSRKERLTDALEQGALEPAVYAERVHSLEAQLADLTTQLTDVERAAEKARARRAIVQVVADIIKSVPEYIRHAPAQEVSAQLRLLIEKVLVFDESRIEIRYWP